MNKKQFLSGILLAGAASLFAQTEHHHLPQTLQTKHSASRSTACLIDSMVESYNNGSGWQDNGYYIHFYDSHGNLVMDVFPQNSDTTKYINTYDNNGRLATQSTQHKVTSSSWIITQKNTYTYDANGHLTSDTEQEADSNNVLVTTYYYAYDSFDSHGNPITETDIDYTSSPADTTEYQYIYTYDASGNIATMILQEWNGSAWENLEQATYTYDANGNTTSEIWQEWDGSAWENYYKEDHYYSTNANCEIAGIAGIGSNVVSVYPNPFTDKLTVGKNIPYQLFDMLGREADKNNLSQLPAGTYIVKTDVGSARVVKM